MLGDGVKPWSEFFAIFWSSSLLWRRGKDRARRSYCHAGFTDHREWATWRNRELRGLSWHKLAWSDVLQGGSSYLPSRCRSPPFQNRGLSATALVFQDIKAQLGPCWSYNHSTCDIIHILKLPQDLYWLFQSNFVVWRVTDILEQGSSWHRPMNEALWAARLGETTGFTAVL